MTTPFLMLVTVVAASSPAVFGEPDERAARTRDERGSFRGVWRR